MNLRVGFCALFFAACGSSAGTIDAGVSTDAGLLDSGAPDSGRAYGHVPPPSGELQPALQSQTWIQHFTDDLRPFWMMPEAFGTPEGNFPTYRGMDGSIQNPRERRPRMIARQVYAYSMGYLLTGEARLLELAHAGMEWLRLHARDPRGGCHERLTEIGAPIEGPKTAQDTTYCALGFAAYNFVTRNVTAENEMHALRDLLFDPAIFWDAENKRIRDGHSADLSAEYDVENDGGWELVAQLDAVNAFMLLAQPVLREESRRQQYLADLKTLAQTMIDTFWQNGIFWGVHTNKGRYGTKHVDFGHTLKTYWMILQIDKRLPDAPFKNFLTQNIRPMLDLAYDDQFARWAKRPINAGDVEYGSDWWIYAEADQLAMTFDLAGGEWRERRAATQQNWLTNYVDRARPAREVISGIRRDGSPVFGWPNSDTAKCNQWKNGFHSVEHALIGYLGGTYLENSEAELHFAVPEADVSSFIAKPYVFEGREVSRTPAEEIMIGGAPLRHVRVRFAELY